MELTHCSFLFVLGPVFICWGLVVLGTSLGTLAITTSYSQVFPFGAPLWTGTLFMILGCFILAAFRPSGFKVLASSTKAQIWFTLVISVLATIECVLALAMFVWYRVSIFPALQHCTSDTDFTTPSPSTVTCECTRGFIDPPSLRIAIHQFMKVSDCSTLGGTLAIFQWILLTLYSLGVLLSTVAGFLVGKRLHSLGVCGKSGVYSVTLQPTPSIPDSAISHQQSVVSSSHPTSSHHTSSLPGFTLIQRFPGSSSQTIPPPSAGYAHSPTVSRPPARSLRLISTGSSPSHTAV